MSLYDEIENSFQLGNLNSIQTGLLTRLFQHMVGVLAQDWLIFNVMFPLQLKNEE